jgi:hypothetical protein
VVKSSEVEYLEIRYAAASAGAISKRFPCFAPKQTSANQSSLELGSTALIWLCKLPDAAPLCSYIFEVEVAES